MKIAYLEAGPLLDYWVAVAAGYEPVYQAESTEGPRVHQQDPRPGRRAGTGAVAPFQPVDQLEQCWPVHRSGEN